MSQQNRDEELQKIAAMLAEKGIDLPPDAHPDVNAHWRILEAMACSMETYSEIPGASLR